MKSNKYIHIYDSLKKDIISGLYPYGSKLPSKRVCADTFHVSVISVEHAYSLLMEEADISSPTKLPIHSRLPKKGVLILQSLSPLLQAKILLSMQSQMSSLIQFTAEPSERS